MVKSERRARQQIGLSGVWMLGFAMLACTPAGTDRASTSDTTAAEAPETGAAGGEVAATPSPSLDTAAPDTSGGTSAATADTAKPGGTPAPSAPKRSKTGAADTANRQSAEAATATAATSRAPEPAATAPTKTETPEPSMTADASTGTSAAGDTGAAASAPVETTATTPSTPAAGTTSDTTASDTTSGTTSSTVSGSAAPSDTDSAAAAGSVDTQADTQASSAGGQGGKLIATQAEYNGWKTYHVYCYRCHGVEALGSDLAPNLRESLKGKINAEGFMQIVKEGRIPKGMPAWKTLLEDEKVKELYAYVKARSDGRLAPGRPTVDKKGN